MPKIDSENKFLTSIKGYICTYLSKFTKLLPNINSHRKFEENWLKMLPAES